MTGFLNYLEDLPVSPKQIFTVHGFASEFAQTLRELGFDVEILKEKR